MAQAQPPQTDPRLQNTQFTPQDIALRSAYEGLLRYDKASGDQKGLYVMLRQWVIYIGFATTLIAVIASTISPEFSALIDAAVRFVFGWTGVQPDGVAGGLLRFLLLVLPLFSAGILGYSSDFVPSNLWFDYRVLAERLRREIFLYRTNGAGYNDKSPHDQQVALLEMVRQVDAESSSPVSVHQQIVQDAPDFEARVKAAMYEENPFSALTVEQYIKQRLIPQRKWYLNKCYDDHNGLRRTRITALVVAGTGSAFAFINREPWVAVTTALSLAISMSMDLRMYGRTYNIYHLAAQQLRSEYDLWFIQNEDLRKDPAQRAEFIGRVEKIFADEIENWTRQAKQSSSELEEAMSRSLESEMEMFDEQTGEVRVSVTAPASADTGSVIEAAAATAAAASAGETETSAAQIEVIVSPTHNAEAAHATNGASTTTANGESTPGIEEIPVNAEEAATTKGMNDGTAGTRESEALG